jgi:glycosyltransferase involved in cell wall biosynthesis
MKMRVSFILSRFSSCKSVVEVGLHFSEAFFEDQALTFNSNVEVLPTGLDVQAYDLKKEQNDGRIRLVWIGGKSTLGYIQEISHVLEKIGEQCENVILRIICDDFFELKNMNVEKVLWDSDSRYTALKECDISLAPLPSNRFTEGKCSFKLLEYSAASLLVVASPVGTNVDNIIEGSTGFLASNPNQWLQKILQLIKDETLRKQTGQAKFLFKNLIAR